MMTVPPTVAVVEASDLNVYLVVAAPDARTQRKAMRSNELRENDEREDAIIVAGV